MKQRLLIVIIVLVTVSFFVFESGAQYTGHDIEQKKPENLYPEPGPGEAIIIREIQETNRLLLQQTDLLKEQNRLLRDSLAKQEPSPAD